MPNTTCQAIGPHHGDRCNGGRVQCPNAQFTEDCPACHGTGVEDKNMSEFKGTPGPWEVSETDQMRVNVKRGLLLHPFEARIATEKDLEDYGDGCHDDWNICQCDDEFFMREPDECEANARLIAAAPDLLAACQGYADENAHLCDCYERRGEAFTCWACTFKDVIAKALGTDSHEHPGS